MPITTQEEAQKLIAQLTSLLENAKTLLKEAGLEVKVEVQAASSTASVQVQGQPVYHVLAKPST